MTSIFRNLLKSIIGPPLSSMLWYMQEAVSFAERRALMQRLGHCEADLALSPPWDIRGEQHIFIGEDVYIGPHVVMLADKGAEIHIGNKVMFGPQVKVIANDHRLPDVHGGDSPGHAQPVGQVFRFVFVRRPFREHAGIRYQRLQE